MPSTHCAVTARWLFTRHWRSSLMKTKSFDAIEIKRRGQEALLTRLESMTAAERQEFWRQQNEELHEWQRQLRAQRDESDHRGEAALTTADHLGERAQRGERVRFERAMGKVADVEPEERDRL